MKTIAVLLCAALAWLTPGVGAYEALAATGSFRGPAGERAIVPGTAGAASALGGDAGNALSTSLTPSALTGSAPDVVLPQSALGPAPELTAAPQAALTDAAALPMNAPAAEGAAPILSAVGQPGSAHSAYDPDSSVQPGHSAGPILTVPAAELAASQVK
ncbi:MAG TPA: hypothetical protein VNI01_04295, partial [Elusimicrobiota bacterium]|nr:hypothetical protein [Elusimicrobiota bacterium]